MLEKNKNLKKGCCWMEITNYNIWVDILGYEGLYIINKKGEIKSVKRNTFKIPQRKKLGYYDVQLFKRGISNRYLIHRLVAIAFLPNPHNYSQINHIDEDKGNNHVDNLEWCTPKYNQRYSHGRTVLQYDRNGSLIKEWDSMRETEEYGYNHGAIYRCCIGQDKHHKNSIWRYKDGAI